MAVLRRTTRRSTDAVSTTTPRVETATPEVRSRRHGERGVARPVLASRRTRRPVVIALAVLAGALIAGVSTGPADLSLGVVARALLAHVPFLHLHTGVTQVQSDIVWQVRMPRVVLGALVGAMLAGGGAAYQGVFRNPLADPYLLGVAAGAGLGATVVIVAGPGMHQLVPLAAFVGAAGAVVITYTLGARTSRGRATVGIVLAGVAVAAFLTAVQTYVQQQHTQDLQEVYTWILGRLTTATWSDVAVVIPYAAVSATILLAHRRHLDVLRVGEDEATTLGIHAPRVRLLVVIGATIGTAAAVAFTGLIGFVGIIVPHIVRLTAGSSYRVVLPVSLIGGAAFLVLADIAARTVQAPTEIPIGIVTAFIGAPFFLFVLQSRRAQRGV
ncbi:MAG TPA: iron chelate uptake ABC transporter family permease subunit [Acidimicrobiales bacterium]|nr:iron chelate uptake ABC transporter family permease subunit [Acidimicrobiales bacterium]